MAGPMSADREGSQERDSTYPTERTSKEMFSELVDKARSLDQNLGGKFLTRVEPSVRSPFYVFPFREEGSDGFGFGLDSEMGPLFLEGYVASRVAVGGNINSLLKTGQAKIQEVSEEDLPRWFDGVNKSVEVAKRMVAEEARRRRIGLKVLELMSSLAKTTEGDSSEAPRNLGQAEAVPDDADRYGAMAQTDRAFEEKKNL